MKLKVVKQELEKEKAENEDLSKRLAAAKAGASEAEAKADEQLARAEKYKKRFIDNHEQIKRLKEEKEQAEEETKSLRLRLDSAEHDSAKSEKAVRDRFEEELAKSKESLASARQSALEFSEALERLKVDRDLLAEKFEESSSYQDGAVATQAAMDELEIARTTIRNLEQQLVARKPQLVTHDEYEALKAELSEVQEQAVVDLCRKNAEVANLKKELLAASSVKSNGVLNAVSEEGNTMDVLALQEEIEGLKQGIEKDAISWRNRSELTCSPCSANTRSSGDWRKLD